MEAITTRPALLEVPSESTPDDRRGVLSLLASALAEARVPYCQWKGHWKRERWESGEGDVDLLVARSDLGRLAEVLARFDFKQVIEPAGRRIPGIYSYYGHDPESGELLHLHVHTRLVLGSFWRTCWQVPIEAAILESARPGPVFPVPAPELEWLLFVLRANLEPGGSRGSRFESELRYLERRADPLELERILRAHLPAIDRAFFEECARGLSTSSPRSGGALRRRLRRSLGAYARRPGPAQLLLAIRERLARSTPGIRRSRNRLATGGAIVAFVGGDGSGKTSAISDLAGWLGRRLDTAVVHMGKPPKSAWSLGVAVLNRAARLLRIGGAADQSPWNPATMPAFLRLAWSAAIAYDRRRTYRRARAAADRGAVVLCDRYPTPQVPFMDGPMIERYGKPASRAASLFLRIERECYRQILSPDVLVVLRAHPEIAVRRKTDEDPEYVRERSRQFWELEWDSRVCVVDAGRPRDEVLAEIKSYLWNRL